MDGALVGQAIKAGPVSEHPARTSHAHARSEVFRYFENSIQAVDSPDDMNPTKRPLLFVHGAEFTDEAMVVRDLILPFFKGAGLETAKALELFDVYFISWNSRLMCPDSRPELHRRFSRFGRPLKFTILMREWGGFYRDLEDRAQAAACHILPYAQKLFAFRDSPPLVVTHSMGAYLWATALKELDTLEVDLPPSLGSWWSLQPALPRNAFQVDGDFNRVAALYTRLGGSHEVWYTRLDLVLALIYPAVKKQRALGQSGCRLGNFGRQFDLTTSARDAHGGVRLFPGDGDFFSRISRFLTSRLHQEIHASAAVAI